MAIRIAAWCFVLMVLNVAVLASRIIVAASGYPIGSVAPHIIAAFGLLVLLCGSLVYDASVAVNGEGDMSG